MSILLEVTEEEGKSFYVMGAFDKNILFEILVAVILEISKKLKFDLYHLIYYFLGKHQSKEI